MRRAALALFKLVGIAFLLTGIGRAPETIVCSVERNRTISA